jgi:hypothetical protein
MLRFAKNRWWWTLILALSFSLTSFATTNRAHADGPSIISDPAPNATGDPDQPTGPGKQAVGRGRMVGQPVGTYSRTPATVGDGRLTSMPWMVRLLIIVRGLRSFYFRF